MSENTISIQLPQQDYSVKDGLTLLTSIYKNMYVQEVSGIRYQYYTVAMGDYQFGNTKRFPARFIPVMNQAILAIGQDILQTRLTEETIMEQLKVLGKKIPLTYLFIDRLRWTEGKMKQRIMGVHSNMYGKMEPDTVRRLNELLVSIAATTLQIHLVSDEQENTPNNAGSDGVLPDSSR